jgi:hypothetical protein
MVPTEQSGNLTSWMHHRQHYYAHRQTASELANRVENGTIGCFRRIGIDGTELPKMEQGLRLYNARIGCDTQAMGACLNAPCLNSGQCVPKEPNAYRYRLIVNEISNFYFLVVSAQSATQETTVKLI